MRWPGFRKVRGQVCKRIHRRLHRLGLADGNAYRDYLQSHPDEWQVLDDLCRITISRFNRDKMAFAFLEREVLPALAHEALKRGEDTLCVWSAGCGAGEEPYTMAILWDVQLKSHFPGLALYILATDADTKMIERAQKACYQYGSLKDLPVSWRERAFIQVQDSYCLRPEYKTNAKFICHDVRTAIPDGPFHLVLCRNLAFTYFNEMLQLKVANQIRDGLTPGGVLMLGVHEKLPEGYKGFSIWSERLGFYQKCDTSPTSTSL